MFFDNYYLYYNSSNFFSLICQINIAACYSSCKNCTPNEVGTETNHHCKECKDNFYQKEDDSNGDFNCYEKNESISNYYYDKANNQFRKCDDSCKLCNKSNSCISCKDRYYFKCGDYPNTNICFTGEQNGYYLNITNEFNEASNICYEKCYNTCSTCFGKGNESNHNCKDCKNHIRDMISLLNNVRRIIRTVILENIGK